MKTVSVAARVMLLIAVVSILWLALTPNPPRAGFDLDKVNHIVAFFVLAGLMEYAFPNLGAWAVKLLPLVAFGLAIEMLQFWIGYRYFEWMDLVADGVGLLLFWILCGKIRTTLDPLIRRVMKD